MRTGRAANMKHPKTTEALHEALRQLQDGPNPVTMMTSLASIEEAVSAELPAPNLDEVEARYRQNMEPEMFAKWQELILPILRDMLNADEKPRP